MIALPHELPPAPGPLADRAAFLRDALPVLTTPRLGLDAPDLTDFPAWADGQSPSSRQSRDAGVGQGQRDRRQAQAAVGQAAVHEAVE